MRKPGVGRPDGTDALFQRCCQILVIPLAGRAAAIGEVASDLARGPLTAATRRRLHVKGDGAEVATVEGRDFVGAAQSGSGLVTGGYWCVLS